MLTPAQTQAREGDLAEIAAAIAAGHPDAEALVPAAAALDFAITTLEQVELSDATMRASLQHGIAGLLDTLSDLASDATHWVDQREERRFGALTDIAHARLVSDSLHGEARP